MMTLAGSTGKAGSPGPASAPAQAGGPPRPVPRPEARGGHGEGRRDAYAWMEAGEGDELLGYLRAENRWAAAVMAGRRRLQVRLRREFRARVPSADRSAGLRRGPFLYYSRTLPGRELAVHCRRRGGGPEEVVLDPNELAAGETYLELGEVAVSPDHRLVAFSCDTEGDERFHLRVRDIATGRELAAPVSGTSGEVAWAADSRWLLYVSLDRTLRPWAVRRRRVTDPPHVFRTVLTEPSPRFHLGVGVSTDRRYLIVSAQGEGSNECFLLEAAQPGGRPWRLHPRQPDVEWHPDHGGGELLVLTNLGAENFRLLRGRVGDPGGPALWPELVPERADATLEDFAVVPGWVALLHRERGLSRLSVQSLTGGAPRPVVLTDEPAAVELIDEGDPECAAIRFAWSSPRLPWREERLEPASGRRRRLKTQRIPGGHREGDYRCERLWVPAGDGRWIPLTLVRHRKRPAAPGPCLLTAYAAYGDCLEPEFDLRWPSLLDRGVAVALAHGRGGGELGEAWHRQGRGRCKERSVADFIACADFLIATGVAAADRVAAEAASAGGLLLGAALNRRPELFRAVLMQAPFLDLLSSMENPELPLTTGEYREWGDPAQAEDHQAMRRIDPYLNLAAADYPALLLRAGLQDSRVPCWQPAKWMARLRELCPEPGPARLLRTDLHAGHGGRPGRYAALRDSAFDYAFLLAELGIEA